jgi:PAS domain S-box-containing protein
VTERAAADMSCAAPAGAAEDQVRRIEALSGTGSFFIDGREFTEVWSEGMYRIHGVGAAAFDGTRAAHLRLIHHEDRDRVAAMLTAALEHGVAGRQDHRLAATGGASWASTTVAPVLDQFGRPAGIDGFCQDVSERKQTEIRLRELDAIKDDLLATVVHKLRTPLTSVGGYASVLRKKHPDLDELVGPIERNAADMSRMIETLLELCRLSADQFPIRPQPLELAALVQDCVRSAPDGPDYGVDIPADVEVVADGEALRQIMSNLLMNAAQYSDAPATVRVDASREADGSTLIRVADAGPGIAPSNLERIFDRFYQVPGTRRGCGLGLAIVREYASRLGGDVWCESTEGAGATFVVQLP